MNMVPNIIYVYIDISIYIYIYSISICVYIYIGSLVDGVCVFMYSIGWRVFIRGKGEGITRRIRAL